MSIKNDNSTPDKDRAPGKFTTWWNNIKEHDMDETFQKAQTWTRIGARVADLIVQIRGQPRAADYVAIALGAADVAMEIHAETRDDYMAEDELIAWARDNGWHQLPNSLIVLTFEHITSQRKFRQQGLPKMFSRLKLTEGSIGDERFMFRDGRSSFKFKGATPQDPAALKVSQTWTPNPLWFREDRFEETMTAMSNAFWSKFSSNDLVYSRSGLGERVLDTEEMYETQFIRDLRERVSTFANAGINRGYLIDGLPGTGKSQASLIVSQSLSMRTLKIEIGTLTSLFAPTGNYKQVDIVIKLTKPDVVIIDDIDRVPPHDQAELLALLEIIKASVKVLLVTTNNKDDLLNPILRPGRLDDHIEVPHLEENVILNLIGEDTKHLIDKFTKWPISFIRDFAHRKQALGLDKATEEIPKLEARVTSSAKNNVAHLDYEADLLMAKRKHASVNGM